MASKKRKKFIPREIELVPSDEYSTDDSFGESQRRAVTGEVSKTRLETIETSIATYKAMLAKLPPLKDKKGKKLDMRKYSEIHDHLDTGLSVSEQVSLLREEVSTTTTNKSHKSKMGKEKKKSVRRSPRLEEKKKGSSSRQADSDNSPRSPTPPPSKSKKRKASQAVKSPLFDKEGNIQKGPRAKASLFTGVPRGLGSKTPKGRSKTYSESDSGSDSEAESKSSVIKK